MQKRYGPALLLLAWSAIWALPSARAQASSQPPPDAPQPQTGQSAPNSSSSDKASSSDKNDKGDKKDRQDKSQTTPASPDTSPRPDASGNQPPAAANPGKKASSADDNPFPEDISKKAASDAKAAAAAPPASGKADPTQGSSSREGLDKLGLDDSGRRVLKLESPDGSSDVYDPKRATEDVRVGRFYLQTGDLKGAYERFKDATSFDHEDAEAVFWLAEAARRLNHPQEAQQNYQVYLEAVPDGPNSKAARKALSDLSSSSKP